MLLRAKTFLKAIWSEELWRQRYERRRTSNPTQGNRTIASMVILSGALLMLLLFTFSTADEERDDKSYLATRPGVIVLADEKALWRQSQVVVGNCGFATECYRSLRLTGWQNLAPWSAVHTRNNPHNQPANTLLSMSFPKETLSSLMQHRYLVLALPKMSFQRAEVFINQQYEGTYLSGRLVTVPIESESLKHEQVRIDVVLRMHPNQPWFGTNSAPAFFATQDEYDAYRTRRDLTYAGRGTWVMIVARITLAILACVLFLLIDASPESLGMALFMSFDAINLGIRNGWLPLPWTGVVGEVAVYSFCVSMGIIIRLYFYLQIARVGNKSVSPWLLLGTPISIAYAMLALDAMNRPMMNWDIYVSNLLLLCASSIGIVICLRALWSIRNQRLWWRSLALSCAVLGSAGPALAALDGIFFERLFLPESRHLLNTLKVNAPFLLSLSAFFNIIALERRALKLTEAKIRAGHIDDDLEAAKAVQNSLLKIPALPATLDFSVHTRSSSMVHQCAFYAHWDSNEEVFTFLLNEVAGNGLQTALKLTICKAMADALWVKGIDRRATSEFRSKLTAYHNLVSRYLSDRTSEFDEIGIVGAEFNAKTGRILIYRVDAPAPIFMRKDNTHIKAEMPAHKTGTVVSYNLQPGTGLVFAGKSVLASDEKIERVLRELNKQPSDAEAHANTHKLNSQHVCNAVAATTTDSQERITRDRTILVFRWLGKEAELKNDMRNTG